MSKENRTTGHRPAGAPGTTGELLQRASMLYSQGQWAEAERRCRTVLEREPAHPGALTLLGIVLAQTHRPQEAAPLLGRVAAVMPDNAEAHGNYGNVLRTLGRSKDALQSFERALALNPNSAQAHHNRALTLGDLGRAEEALASYERALALQPDHAPAWNNRGGALRVLGRYDEALTCIDRAINLQPQFVPAHNNRGVILLMLGRFEEALVSCERVLALQPNDVGAHANRGIALRMLERYEQALASVDRALGLYPDYVEGHVQRADILHALGRDDEAVDSYDRVIALQPNDAEVHARRGAALAALYRHSEALASYARALEIDPRCVNALVNRGVTLYELKRFDDALGSLNQALRLNPRDAQIYTYRAAVLQERDAIEEAIASYDKALAIDPRIAFLPGNCCHARMQVCDWSRLTRDTAAIVAALERGEAAATPFVMLSLLDAPALQRRTAEIWVEKKFSAMSPASAPRHPRHEKIRVGYFSADLSHHAVAMLAAGLFETHDRSRFELTAFSLGTGVPDSLRARIQAACERFMQVDGKSDRELVALARELQIDIAVDLGGYTRDARPGIFAQRAAPIQVSYLGYLGTLGGSFIDYLLADPVLVPSRARAHYSEKIAYLPSYQVNDAKRPVAARSFTRAELGLPPRGFVFCCFNNTYKITPETFESWMRILSAVPHSVLFLLGGCAATERNLRGAAERCGVSPDRLVFGRVLPVREYLARYRSADLFLDTLPYNAGTTASDALWAGLPVLTLAGESFASRMAASIVTAAGLSELVVHTRDEYERLAIDLASDATRLEALKRSLAANRSRCALFDTATFTGYLESLYQQMYERYWDGQPAAHLFAADCRSS